MSCPRQGVVSVGDSLWRWGKYNRRSAGVPLHSNTRTAGHEKDHRTFASDGRRRPGIVAAGRMSAGCVELRRRAQPANHGEAATGKPDGRQRELHNLGHCREGEVRHGLVDPEWGYWNKDER